MIILCRTANPAPIKSFPSPRLNALLLLPRVNRLPAPLYTITRLPASPIPRNLYLPRDQIIRFTRFPSYPPLTQITITSYYRYSLFFPPLYAIYSSPLLLLPDTRLTDSSSLVKDDPSAYPLSDYPLLSSPFLPAPLTPRLTATLR